MLISKLLILFIGFYQGCVSFVLRIFISGNCRFTPTCSEYSHSAIQKYGALKGSVLSFRRIVRCNPLSVVGYDPVK